MSLVVLEVSPGDPPDVPSRTPRKLPKWARGLLGPEIVKFSTGFVLKSTQILTAAESGNFAPPGPVRICSYFGSLAGPIFGRILRVFVSRIRFENAMYFSACTRAQDLDSIDE